MFIAFVGRGTNIYSPRPDILALLILFILLFISQLLPS